MTESTAAAYRNILVIRQSALGDVANILPALQVLRDAYPDARLTCVTGRPTAPLLEADPCVDEVIVCDRSFRPDRFFSLLLGLRRKRFDLVVDLHCNRFSRWLALATGAGRRIGAHFPGFYTDLIRFDLGSEQICEIFRRFLQPLGLERAPYHRRFPDLERAVQLADNFLLRENLPQDGFVVFNPGHSPAWGTKRWPEEHWIDLGRALVASGYAVLITGGPGEAELALRLAAGIGDGAAATAGRTDILCLGGLMRRAAVVVSTDSGPMHVAAMAGARVVALFGPTHPVTSAPFGAGHRIMHRDIPCSYCFKKVCPYNHECLDQLQPESVLEAVNELLAAPAVGEGEG